MRRHHFLIVSTTLPDDTIENDHDILVFPGQSIGVAIAEHLTALGLRPMPLTYLEHAGWEVCALLGRGLVGFRINSPYEGETMIPIWYNPSFLDRLILRSDPAYPQLIADLAQRLRADPRFVNPKWHRVRRQGAYDEDGYDMPTV